MAGEAIATLNAIVRMDTSRLEADVGEAKRKVQGFEKGVSKAGFSAEKLGSILTGRFLSAGAAIGTATMAVRTLASELERLATIKLGDLSVLQESRTERFTWAVGEGLQKWPMPSLLGGRRGARVVDWMQEQWNEFSGLSEIRTTAFQSQHDAAFRDQQERRRRLEMMRAQISDATTGGNSALGLARRWASDKEVFDLNEQLNVANRFKALMEGLKDHTDHFRESMQLLKEALDQGVISLEQYTDALSRLRRASGRAVEVNTLTAVRTAGVRTGGTGGGGSGFKDVATQVLIEIRDRLARDGAAVRLN